MTGTSRSLDPLVSPRFQAWFFRFWGNPVRYCPKLSALTILFPAACNREHEHWHSAKPRRRSTEGLHLQDRFSLGKSCQYVSVGADEVLSVFLTQASLCQGPQYRQGLVKNPNTHGRGKAFLWSKSECFD